MCLSYKPAVWGRPAGSAGSSGEEEGAALGGGSAEDADSSSLQVSALGGVGCPGGLESDGGGEGTGGAGRRGTAEAAAVLWAPVATGGGISASFTGRPFLAAVSIVSRVCEEQRKRNTSIPNRVCTPELPDFKHPLVQLNTTFKIPPFVDRSARWGT